MSDDEQYLRALEVQRRNFEAQFGAIEDLGYVDKSREGSGSKEVSESEEDSEESSEELSEELSEEEDSEEESGSDSHSDSDSQSEFTGFEDNKQTVPVRPKVFKLNDTTSTHVPISKADRKLLKSGRAPTLQEIERKQKLADKQTEKQKRKATQEDSDNLENDIKLQRLLDESHILANSLQYSGADVTLQTLDYEDPTGNARKRTMDSRIRSLAAINSKTGGLPHKLENMPMSMRKGMIKSRDRKIQKYEQEAKDAGIVLSKVKKGQLRDLNAGRGYTSQADRLGTGKKNTKTMRDRGLKIASVGRSTRNGLVIPQDLINKINSRGHRNDKKKRR
ncbi:uncharacterized protein RJT21DRAFT_30818 [Scheffersomyces amazonensis]|uniref:uncharacterized protein n=1 Tax=Scheffersomyces amazonensis TaxID=1078765 RepID=UPI00315D61F1